MKRILSIALIALLLTAVLPAFAEDTEIETIVTIVTAPEQTEAQRPPCFVDPTDNYVPLPETENYALNKPVASGEFTDVYVETNVNDGSTSTYWESKGWPAEMAIDLQGTYTFSKDISLSAGYTLMFGTDTMDRLKQGKSSKQARWGWFSLVISPTIFTTKW